MKKTFHFEYSPKTKDKHRMNLFEDNSMKNLPKAATLGKPPGKNLLMEYIEEPSKSKAALTPPSKFNPVGDRCDA